VEWFDPAISKRLLGFQPDDVQWVISFAYAIRRANSIEAAIEILLNAEPKFPKQAVIKYNLACYFCQLGDLESVKKYLKRAFEIDPNWRLQALEDEDLEALWEKRKNHFQSTGNSKLRVNERRFQIVSSWIGMLFSTSSQTSGFT